MLKVSLLGANHAGAFVGSVCEQICPKNLWIRHWQLVLFLVHGTERLRSNLNVNLELLITRVYFKVTIHKFSVYLYLEPLHRKKKRLHWKRNTGNLKIS